MNKYSRGSEWRKWDLHVHTAASYDHGYKSADSEEKLVAAWKTNDIISFAKQHDAIISIHAGGKSNCVDDQITNTRLHNQARKSKYADNIHIFEVGKIDDISDYKNIVFKSRKALYFMF